ncbi:hypothetical protein F5Y09DRAFT_346211 [Xylaria sp. FL1042]|nr:hypothetical protein F5Y09DRAFT_346211 [Xylaria sp. FL1042]
MSMIPNRSTAILVLVGLAKNGTEGSPTNGLNNKQVTAIVATSLLFLIAALWIGVYCARYLARQPPSRFPISDEGDGPNDDPFPLMDLQACANLGLEPTTARGAVTTMTAPGPPTGAGDETTRPEFSVADVPPPCHLNQHTPALSSNPPAQADLDVARNTLHPSTNDQETMPATEAGPSSEQVADSPSPNLGSTPSSPTLPRLRAPDSVEKLEGRRDERRYGMVLEPHDLPMDFANEELSSEPESSPLPVSGVETESDGQRQKGKMPASESLPQKTDVLAHNRSSLSPLQHSLWMLTGETHEPREQHLRTHGDNQANENEGQAKDDKMKDGGIQAQVSGKEARRHRPRSAGAVPKHTSSDQKSPLSSPDVNGSRYNLLEFLRDSEPSGGPHGAGKETQQLLSENGPLVALPRRVSYIHPTSGLVTTTTAPRKPRPTSAFEPGRFPDFDVPRATSHPIYHWLWPRDVDENPPFHLQVRERSKLSTPAPPDAIEQSRLIYEERQWDLEARRRVLQMAKEAYDHPSEEEIQRRVTTLKRRSRFAPKENVPEEDVPGPSHAGGNVNASEHSLSYLDPNEGEEQDEGLQGHLSRCDTAPSFVPRRILPRAASVAEEAREDEASSSISSTLSGSVSIRGFGV